MVDQAVLPMEKLGHKTEAQDSTTKLLADVDTSVMSYERSVSQTIKSLNERNFDAKMALNPSETAALSKIEEALVRGNPRGLQDIVGKYKDDPDSLTKVMKVVQDDLAQSKVKCSWKVDTENGKKFGALEVQAGEQSVAFRTDKSEPAIAHDGRPWYERNWDNVKDAAKDAARDARPQYIQIPSAIGPLYAALPAPEIHTNNSTKEMRFAEQVLEDVAWTLRPAKAITPSLR